MIIHQPVLLAEVLELLQPPEEGGLMVDGTLGQGGHAAAMLERHPRLTLIGIDADPEVLETARRRLAAFGGRVELVRAWFADVFETWQRELRPDLVLLDLGISRFHFEASARGFSFERDEPLDMRLDPTLPRSAADLVNAGTAAEIADILSRYGEEPFARAIAARIVARRPLATSRALAEAVRSAVPPARRHGRIHPATRTFQALRIAVNDELGQLERGLAAGFRVLAPGGRIGVISFHSLEDRLVKRFFAARTGRCTCPPGIPVCQCGRRRELSLVTAKPVCPGSGELARNPASRSAKLRVALKAAA